MSLPVSLLPMNTELFPYGLFAGILIEKVKLNSFASVAIVLLIGRIIFLLSFILLNQGVNIHIYLETVILPGLITAVAQIISIPFIAKFLIK